MGRSNATTIGAGLRGSLGSTLDGFRLHGMQGTVEAVNAHGANTVDVYLNNNAAGAQPSLAMGLPCASDYNPKVGDGVFVLVGTAGMRTSYFVLGTALGGSNGGGSNGIPIGAIVLFGAAFSSTSWLLCNGGTFSAVTYPALDAFLGSTTLPNVAGHNYIKAL